MQFVDLTALVKFFNRCLRPECARCGNGKLVERFLPAKRDRSTNAILLTVACHGEFDTMELTMDDVFSTDWQRTGRGTAFSSRQTT